MAKVKVGVIGVGSMGENHVRIYSTLKEASLVGVFDPSQDRANEIANKYNCRAFPTLESLLKEVDAASLVSPTSLHYQIAAECLNNKVNLLIEKPLADTSARAEEIAVLAEKKKLVVAVGMIERFNPALKKAASIVKHETILGLDLKRYSPFPARISDASVVLDMMLHDFDLAVVLARSEFVSIKASGTKVKTDKLDEASATLYFKDGLIAKLEASRVKPDKKRLITITTDKAIYEVDLLNKQLLKRDFNQLLDKQSIELKLEDQLTLELKDFLRAVDQGKKPMVSPAEAILPIKLVEEVERLACL